MRIGDRYEVCEMAGEHIVVVPGRMPSGGGFAPPGPSDDGAGAGVSVSVDGGGGVSTLSDDGAGSSGPVRGGVASGVASGDSRAASPAGDRPSGEKIRLVALNETSYYLWQRLRGRDFSLDEAARLLVDRYDVGPEQALRDVGEWVRRLEACGIME